MTLNDEQQAALDAVQRGSNIFLTGAGGTGKSHTIRAIMESNIKSLPAVTAMTGCAAVLLSSTTADASLRAKTLHSWAGVGLGTAPAHELADFILKKRKLKYRWTNTNLLIVDEISMMTAELLEKLDLVARRVRKRPNDKFGGIQLVFAGDFCQLPPVGLRSQQVPLVFQTPIWSALIDETIELTQIQRQADPVFQRILNEARIGALTPESITILEGRKGLPWQNLEVRPTLLFTRNSQVDTINAQNMEALDGERRIFKAKTTYKPTMVLSASSGDQAAALQKLDADAAYQPELELCVGAQVMLLINLDQERGLVNGSRGIVTGFSPGGLPMVRFLSTIGSIIVDRHTWWLADPDYVGRSQIPLRVAYAITIHKSQGATLDSALIDIGGNTFEYGQAYVALSRVRSLDGLYLWKFDPRKVLCHPAVAEFYRNLARSSKTDVTTL